MVNIIIAVVITLAIDWIGGAIVKRIKKKKQERDDDLFISKIGQILQEETIPFKERKDKAKELCRMTEGKMATGAYFTLNYLKEKI